MRVFYNSRFNIHLKTKKLTKRNHQEDLNPKHFVFVFTKQGQTQCEILDFNNMRYRVEY